MKDTLPQLTPKERTELKKLMKLCNKDPHKAVKFEQTGTRNLTNNYYWNRLVAFGLVDTVAYDNEITAGIPEHSALAISQDGHHYFERYHDEQIRQFLNSAIIPLGVSILANTPNWWPMIQGLLKWLL